ncbi:DUF4258 domain-containing protein [Desulfocurvibacter africanus]|uniref:Uncharacterized protein n=1 Tax=Desulfocurvibacter africanus subsp. africanus str. Walvis Bay TaxID=690850 RepID=F3Z2V3_DESAF|nr:DUF4258 domain-containing protein [Desulfocurvibacter africanus]EGJ50270.1 hypothetical protein Desaf_1941 [Desulfocurvibacter africanus subsp. africanus str. Walvis Bay]
MATERLFVTRHAQRRMDERGIGMPTLQAVLRHGKTTWAHGPDLRVVCELLGFQAVIDPLCSAVITVFERRAS